jgi:mediator of RNA polymerase II transcription subunit 5
MTELDKQLQQNLDQQLDLGGAGASLDLTAMGVDTSAGDMSADMGNLPDLDLDMGDMGMGMSMDGGEEDWGLNFDGM